MLLVTKGYGEDGAGVWGKYLLAILVLRVFVIVGRFGADTALLKFIAGFNAQKLGENIRLVYRKALSFVLPICIGLSILMYLSSAYISEVMSVPQLYIEYLSFSYFLLHGCLSIHKAFRGLKDMLSFSFFFNSAVTSFAFIIFGLVFLLSKEDVLNNHQAPVYAFSVGVALAFASSLFYGFEKKKERALIQFKILIIKHF